MKNLDAASLTVGRQELFFGDQRLVGHFGWSNVGRSFDGLRVTYMAAPVRRPRNRRVIAGLPAYHDLKVRILEYLYERYAALA